MKWKHNVTQQEQTGHIEVGEAKLNTTFLNAHETRTENWMRTCKHDTKGRTWEQEAAHPDMSVMRESDRETREKMEQERRHREVNKHGDQTETKQPHIILNHRINNIIRTSKAQEN